MNVLVDRHQAGLYHALQLLFEDRLGHTLYTPIGHDWWDEGYWRFGEVFGDDRLAAQYLPTTGWEDCGCKPPALKTYDDEFPGRAIWGIKLDDAKTMPWYAVVATVQENQRGFKRFADEVGAKFVVQVGNTGQQIDWSLDPFVINSSEMPILGRGVRIGQEFDTTDLFAYADPMLWADRQRIGSFVNCMPQIDCYPVLEQARATLREFKFEVHGINGPEGNVKPITTTARIMRNCGWGWHDKAHGDGFGHVIHYWAAIGRPLIGHASHYAGKNAHVFWRDLETCIDLDRHPFDEAMALVRAISRDPLRHKAMCEAIHDIFYDQTDWEGDARLVAGLLA